MPCPALSLLSVPCSVSCVVLLRAACTRTCAPPFVPHPWDTAQDSHHLFRRVPGIVTADAHQLFGDVPGMFVLLVASVCIFAAILQAIHKLTLLRSVPTLQLATFVGRVDCHSRSDCQGFPTVDPQGGTSLTFLTRKTVEPQSAIPNRPPLRPSSWRLAVDCTSSPPSPSDAGSTSGAKAPTVALG